MVWSYKSLTSILAGSTDGKVLTISVACFAPLALRDHPNPANEGQLKTGQR